MVAKPRIYDLAEALIPQDEDDKARKQKKSDFTKQVIAICNQLGYTDKKSSSASLDEVLIEQIVGELNKGGMELDQNKVIKDTQQVIVDKKAAKSMATQKKEEAKSAQEKPKKVLRIVRRIKPSQQKAEEEERAAAAAAEEAAKNAPPEQKTTISSGSSLKSEEEVKKEEKPKTAEPPRASKPKKAESSKANVDSAPYKIIKPEPEEQTTKHKGKKTQQFKEKSLQPFRVAKPTMVPSMMGRTKRPSQKRKGQAKEKEKEKKAAEEAEKPSIVTITAALTLKELAEKLQMHETEVVKALFEKGVIRTVNQTLELEVAVDCAKTLGYEVLTEEEKTDNDIKPDFSKEAEEDLKPRPPIVTIMGHVDHGKTTLLDAIREAKFNVTESEKGGITQHIGAYQIEVVDYDGKNRKITFLDTPGHEAFTLMRARGAQLTDIAILVVAADDGVMPQTVEAIDHAKSAEVPIVIAMNKIDKEGAYPDKVLGELAEHELLVEDYGGKTVCSKVSAKKKENLDDLLTKITLVADAELSEKLIANPKSYASGVVVEAELSKERGPVTDLLILNGTLKKGDCLVAGNVAGRVRAMFDDHGRELDEAPPATPVEVLGLPKVPHAGDTFQVFKTYQEAKKVADEKHIQEKEKRRSIGLAEFASKVREGQAHELKVIIKADMHGSAEAVSKEVSKLSTKEVLVKPIHIGSGNISESDITLAASSDAIVIGFHVGPDINASKAAQDLGVDIRQYDIIYKITEDLEKAILGLLDPEKEEVKSGEAEVRAIFTYGKGSKIAGSYVTDGKLIRNEVAKVYRKGQMIYEGKLDNLKRFKEDAKEVQTNFECGISFNSFNDLQEGDVIECWKIVEKVRTSL